MALEWFKNNKSLANVEFKTGADLPLIRLQSLKKSYASPAGEVQVLRGIDMQVQAGEFIGILGKSGSGKTTLLNMIAGIDRPTSGEVWVGETPIHQLSEGQMAVWRGRHLGIIFQFFQLLPMLTLLDNVMLPDGFLQRVPLDQRRPRALELLDMVEMADFAHKLPTASFPAGSSSAWPSPAPWPTTRR